MCNNCYNSESIISLMHCCNFFTAESKLYILRSSSPHLTLEIGPKISHTCCHVIDNISYCAK